MELCTSNELIDELTERPLFVGLVIQSRNEAKSHNKNHKKWDISYSNLSEEQVYNLLIDIADHFRHLAEKA